MGIDPTNGVPSKPMEINRREAGVAALGIRMLVRFASERGDHESADEAHKLVRRFEMHERGLPDPPLG